MLEKFLFAILGAFLTLLSSLVLEWAKAKFGSKKSTIDQWKMDYEVSEKIDYIFSLQDKKFNKLQKDRFAKLILKNHKATYKDLKLLIPISNCDYWSKKYFESKKYINLIKDETSGDFIMITYDTPKSKIALLGSGYFVFAMLGLSPYIFSAQLVPFIKAQNEAFSTLLLIVIVLLAVLSICIALLCMTRAGREYSASQFVLNFYKYGVYS